jgi:hypothetical protein
MSGLIVVIITSHYQNMTIVSIMTLLTTFILIKRGMRGNMVDTVNFWNDTVGQ